MRDSLIKKKYFIFIFLILIFIVHNIIHNEENNKIDIFLKEKTEQINLEYQVIYNNYKTLADLIFKTKINKKEVLTLFKNREQKNLYNFLQNDYLKLRDFSIRQLHFHLPNNDSFLRMHRPLKFGDNLTKDRSTVEYVNKHKKYIDGFEEGKIFNGFRFVYPLFDCNDATHNCLNSKQHIGSVEISFSALFFIKEMIKNYKVKSNFFISKEVVDSKVFNDEQSNYIQSPISGYYFQKSILNYIKTDHEISDFSSKFIKSISSEINKGEVFSKYNSNTKEVITFIPLKNPISKKVIAFLTTNVEVTYIESKKKNSRFIFLLLTISIAGTLLFLYKQLIFQISLKKEVRNKTKELKELNLSLKQKVKDEIAKNLKKDKLVQEQSKLASMGEMIGSIAHQWRQPLNVLNIHIQNLEDDFEDGVVDKKFIDKFIKENIKVINFMSHTIDDFRNFFRVDKEKHLFSVKNTINDVISIQDAQLKNHNISVETHGEDFEILGLHNEFKQVILNIINNAKDEFIQRDIKNSKITVTYEKDKISIKDNADGINSNIIDRIFEPYFTTKEQGRGTGMGLYISKIIIDENMKGLLSVHNDKDGAVFVIDFRTPKGRDDG